MCSSIPSSFAYTLKLTDPSERQGAIATISPNKNMREQGKQGEQRGRGAEGQRGRGAGEARITTDN
ncbi:hypothetical protein A6770_20210 [Nostoc minutum NIES-26]|uniref:Uncharacterized protein n=1 Tax=Nostoc minutum NIES-26 TaxID=1844469 RepID=A0A367R4B7_9NOSO|nr:hypothetical protein A6770_20210 [Nostoc minutum NIES-26]